jgi:oligopeptide/dipeptide ABC transporter ATP-binding protein
MSGAAILEVESLTKIFGGATGVLGVGRKHPVLAVDAVSFAVARGETLGIVGESGSGKSTTARLLLRLIEPTSGEIRLNGEDLRGLSADELRRRRRGMQMVFQDPFASLNPRLSVGYQLAEPLRVHGLCGGAEAEARVASLLTRVGLSPSHARSYPHQFSGGQRQRIAIARALAVEPDLIVADEAVSALDVSVRAQILNLLDDIRREAKLSMVFISHDLGVVRHVADRVAVMFLGRIVEIGPVAEVFATPRHPYTRELLEAMPIPDPGRRRNEPRNVAAGEAGDGCSFASRCPLVLPMCRRSQPPLAPTLPVRASACFRAAEVPPFAFSEGRAPSPAQLRLRRLQDRFLAAAGGSA